MSRPRWSTDTWNLVATFCIIGMTVALFWAWEYAR